jgi:hypothetical protein
MAFKVQGLQALHGEGLPQVRLDSLRYVHLSYATRAEASSSPSSVRATWT